MFHKLFYTCEEASLHEVKREHGKVGLGTKLRLWMHRQMCAFCNLFHQQNQKLNRYVSESDAAQKIVATDEMKDRWRSELSSKGSE